MRDPKNVFHLAIPSHDLGMAKEFYELLGCEVARTYEDRITLNFFGDQVVCHFDEGYEPPEPKMYPRHFGVTFVEEAEFQDVYKRSKGAQLKFFKDVFFRFQGKREEHKTFFLEDPSGNLLEFKWYKDPEMIY